MLFYLYSFNINLSQIEYNQLSRLKSISSELDEFFIVSINLSKFIEKDLNDKGLTKLEIEKKLNQYLSSAPSNIIYGIGIWFEPYKLENNVKLNGIYIHQGLDNKNSFKITYEWNTEKYYYPTQKWYLEGFNSKESFFTEPYFDQELVYLTNARSFVRNNEKIGVITVDLVVPLLQNIINRHSSSSRDYTYILTKNKFTLGHFEKDRIEKSGAFISKKYTSLLDVEEAEVDNLLEFNSKYYVVSELLNPKLGWIIKAKTSKIIGFEQTKELFIFLFIGVFTAWVATYYFKKYLDKAKLEKDLANEEIEKNRLQLLQTSKMASLGEMASGVAHEINSPLMVILGKNKQLKRLLENDKINKKEFLQQLETIEKTVFRISNIINGLRTFSRSSGKDDFKFVSISEIVKDATSLVSEKIKHNGVDFRLINIEEKLEVKCRPGQISQVLLNLLSNALDAVLLESVEKKWITLEISKSENTNQLIIKVIDSGPGVSPEIINRIMDPFFTTKDVGKGTGLGLSISKGIIEEHEGKIYLSHELENTTFCIELPCKIMN